MRITLPYPISVNRLWKPGNHTMYLSEEGKAYKDEIGWLARAAGMEPVDYLVEMHFDLYRPRKSGDGSNFIKIVMDGLIGHAYIDDKQSVKEVICRFDDKANPRIEVEIVPAPAILLPCCGLAPVTESQTMVL